MSVIFICCRFNALFDLRRKEYVVVIEEGPARGENRDRRRGLQPFFSPMSPKGLILSAEFFTRPNSLEESDGI
jgi:hypothetical protein